MKTLLILLSLLLLDVSASAQITSAEERMRRETNNSRPAITMDAVLANKFDLGAEPFHLIFKIWNASDLKQIEPNRWEILIAGEGGDYKGIAHLPRAGASVINTIKDGDVVIARIKPDSGAELIVEIIGVSAVNVWE